MNLPSHYIHHLPSDGPALAGLGIGSLVLGRLLGKSNAKHSEEVSICRPHVNVGLNQCLITQRQPSTKLIPFNNYFCKQYRFDSRQILAEHKPTLTWRFFTSNLSLSVVRHIPWKFVRTFFPWTSSEISRNFL